MSDRLDGRVTARIDSRDLELLDVYRSESESQSEAVRELVDTGLRVEHDAMYARWPTFFVEWGRRFALFGFVALAVLLLPSGAAVVATGAFATAGLVACLFGFVAARTPLADTSPAATTARLTDRLRDRLTR